MNLIFLFLNVYFNEQYMIFNYFYNNWNLKILFCLNTTIFLTKYKHLFQYFCYSLNVSNIKIMLLCGWKDFHAYKWQELSLGQQKHKRRFEFCSLITSCIELSNNGGLIRCLRDSPRMIKPVWSSMSKG